MSTATRCLRSPLNPTRTCQPTTSSRAAAPKTVGGGAGARRARVFRVCAAAEESAGEPAALVEFVEGCGCDVSEGVFGFTPFTELFVGRVAMMGFGSGIAIEFATGKGFLMQLGLANGVPNPVLFAALVFLIGGATIAEAKKTADSIQNLDLTVEQYRRYAGLKSFAVDKQEVQASISEYEQKKLSKEIAEKPASDVETEAQPEDNSVEAAPAVTSFGGLTAAAELEYAQQVELSNARWAMVGFAAAILIESYSGAGVVAQLLGYMQATGVLGADVYELLINEFTQYRLPS